MAKRVALCDRKDFNVSINLPLHIICSPINQRVVLGISVVQLRSKPDQLYGLLKISIQEKRLSFKVGASRQKVWLHSM